MSLKHGILGLLSYSPMAGYDLMKVFNNSLAYFWNAQTSQIYRDLDALATEGWVELHEEVQRGKIVKTVFSITEAGREELRRWLAVDVNGYGTYRSLFLLKLFFQGQSGAEQLRRMIEARKVQAEENAAKLREILDAKEGPSDIDELTVFCWSMTAEYGIQQFKAEARWAEDCLAQLDAFERKGS